MFQNCGVHWVILEVGEREDGKTTKGGNGLGACLGYWDRKTATLAQAQKVHLAIREWLK